MCSGSEAGLYLRLIDSYLWPIDSTQGWRVMKNKRERVFSCLAAVHEGSPFNLARSKRDM